MPTSREKDSKSPSASASSATSSKPGAYAKRDDSTGRSRKSGGKGRDRKERSNDAASSSTGRDQNAKSRAKRNPGDGPRNPGAHASSKGKPSTNKRNDTQSPSIIAPGAHISSGRAEERIARKARHPDDVDGDRKSSSSAGASVRSSGQSSNPSRIEAKLRVVGLGRDDDKKNDQMVVENEKPDESNAYQVEAELIEEGDEENENNQTRNQGPAVAVASRFQDDQDPAEEHSRKKRPWLMIVGIVLVVIVGGALAAVFLTRGGSDETSSKVLVEADDTPMPTTSSSISPSSSPSTAPTLYKANSAETCMIISTGESVPNQELVALSFDIRFDVSLTLQPSDVSELVEEMESRMQRIMAPKLAECRNGSRRWLNDGNNRKLEGLERNIVGNAQFFLEYQPDQVCDSSPPTPCILVLAKLNIYLKGDQDFHALMLHIRDILREDLIITLGLTAPFSQIKFKSIRSMGPATGSPSSSPSNAI